MPEKTRLDQIIQAHINAMGGWKNWSQIESLRLSGNIERGSQTIEFCIVKKRPHHIRATITIPIPGNDNKAMQVIRAHDGKHAWSATRRAGAQKLKPEALTDQDGAELLAEASVLPKLMSLWQSGASLRRKPDTNEYGQNQIVIEARPNETDSTYTFYLHPDNFLVLHYTQLNTNGTSIQTAFNNYRTFNGVKFPESTRIVSEQTDTYIMATNSVEIGIGIYNEYFNFNASDSLLVNTSD